MYTTKPSIPVKRS